MESPDLDILRSEFDPAFYQAVNADVDFSGVDPLVHFATQGWREGRDPAPWFSVEAYLARHADVRDADQNSFLHYLVQGRQEAREIFASRSAPPAEPAPSEPESSDLDILRSEFDPAFYQAVNADVDFSGADPLVHFAAQGWREGRDPALWFSVEAYLARHADVRDADQNPFLHYLIRGRQEARQIFASLSAAPAEPAPSEPESSDLDILRSEFDPAFYQAVNADVDFSGADPLVHFAAQGWREGRDPAPWFSVEAYLARHADVRDADQNPFLHYLVQGRQEAREIFASRSAATAEPAPSEPEAIPDLDKLRSEFDPAFYGAHNRDVVASGIDPLVHFATQGWREGRDPAPWFSVEAYLALHADVRDADQNPFLHYVVQGRREARQIAGSRSAAQGETAPSEPESSDLDILRSEFDPAFYQAVNADVDFSGADPLVHFAAQGWREGRDPAPWFSVEAYLARHADVRDADQNPFLHYLVQGRQEAREIFASRSAATAEPAPSEPEAIPDLDKLRSEFDPAFYGAHNRDVVASGIDPLVHFATQGWREGRDPAPWFSVEAYLALHADVRDADQNPFLHYVVQGRREARQIAGSRSAAQGETAHRSLAPTKTETASIPVSTSRNRLGDRLPTLASVGLTESDLADVVESFDEEYYLKQCPELKDAPFDLIAHYMTVGYKQLLNPSNDFDTAFYLSSNPDIAKAGINPFLHYVRNGRRELRPSVPYSKLRSPKYRPLVSVIVPNFNHARFLRERLESIFRQTYRNIEIILLDDFSTDNSVQVLDGLAAISPFPVKKVYNNNNSGNVFAQWERGFALAEGELIWICESDDTCEADALAHLVPKFASRSVMLAFGRIQFCDVTGQMFPGLDDYRERAEPGIWSRPLTRHASEWFGGAFGRNNVIANVGGCVMRNQKISPEIWKEARTYKICGDWYLYIQITGGGDIAFEPNAVTYFRQHNKNTSSANFGNIYYYEEHKKIFRELNYNWNIPQTTQDGFLRSLMFQWRHFKMDDKSDRSADFIALKDTSSVTRREHFLIGSLGFMYGGGEIFPLNLANKLCSMGKRVSLLCSNLNDLNEDILARLDPRIPVFDASEAKAQGAEAFLKRIDATLVHSHVNNIDDIFFRSNAPLSGFPYVVSLHGSHQAEDLGIEALLFRMLRGVSQWVYTADRNLEIFKGVPLDFGALEKIPNAMPLDTRPFPLTRADLKIDADTVVFTFVARGVQQKGWRAAVEALKLLLAARPDAKAHLLMVGAGPKTDEAAKLAVKGLPVTFLGFQACINGLYRISDCALAPTRFVGESFPLCVVQALQEELPVIATRVAEIPAMITRNGQVAGVLIDNIRDSSTFFQRVANAMEEMLDPAKRARAVQVARDLRPQFDMDVMAQRYLAVYERAIRRVGAPAPQASEAKAVEPKRVVARPRVLIIGAAGFMGSHLAARLARANVDVVGLASRQPPNISFARFHIGRSELVSELMAAIEGCETVVFAGGTSRPGSPMRSLGAEIDTEACHLMDVAELCGARGVKRFIFISSGGAVYGPTSVEPIPETHPTRPISSYGLAKMAGEHGLRLVAARTGMSALSLRVANPYGQGQIVKGGQGFVAAALRAMKERIPLEIWGDGRVKRDFIYIDDVTNAFMSAMFEDFDAETVNIGAGIGASLREVVEMLTELSGVPIEVNYKPARSVDVPSVVLDVAKAERLLNWKPTFGLREGLRATLVLEGLIGDRH